MTLFLLSVLSKTKVEAIKHPWASSATVLIVKRNKHDLPAKGFYA